MSLSCCRLPTCTYHLHLSVVYKSYIYAVRVLFRLARGSVCPVVLVYVAGRRRLSDATETRHTIGLRKAGDTVYAAPKSHKPPLYHRHVSPLLDIIFPHPTLWLDLILLCNARSQFTFTSYHNP